MSIAAHTGQAVSCDHLLTQPSGVLDMSHVPLVMGVMVIMFVGAGRLGVLRYAYPLTMFGLRGERRRCLCLLESVEVQGTLI